MKDLADHYNFDFFFITGTFSFVLLSNFQTIPSSVSSLVAAAVSIRTYHDFSSIETAKYDLLFTDRQRFYKEAVRFDDLLDKM